MIKEKDKVFILETKNTAYAFYIDELGLLQHLYYGAKIDLFGDAFLALQQKTPNPNGCSTVLSKEAPTLALDDTCLEFSSRGKGDMREAFVELELADGSRTSDFRYWQHVIRRSAVPCLTRRGCIWPRPLQARDIMQIRSYIRIMMPACIS